MMTEREVPMTEREVPMADGIAVVEQLVIEKIRDGEVYETVVIGPDV